MGSKVEIKGVKFIDKDWPGKIDRKIETLEMEEKKVYEELEGFVNSVEQDRENNALLLKNIQESIKDISVMIKDLKNQLDGVNNSVYTLKKDQEASWKAHEDWHEEHKSSISKIFGKLKGGNNGGPSQV